MKYRDGFVSNSSSSSFIIGIAKISEYSQKQPNHKGSFPLALFKEWHNEFVEPVLKSEQGDAFREWYGFVSDLQEREANTDDIDEMLRRPFIIGRTRAYVQARVNIIHRIDISISHPDDFLYAFEILNDEGDEPYMFDKNGNRKKPQIKWLPQEQQTLLKNFEQMPQKKKYSFMFDSLDSMFDVERNG